MYKVIASRQAKKDAVNVERNGLKPEVEKIIETVERDPYYPSQEFEELKGNWKGVYSRRINRKHRFVYVVLPNVDNELDASETPYDGIIRVLTMWTHYERL